MQFKGSKKQMSDHPCQTTLQSESLTFRSRYSRTMQSRKNGYRRGTWLPTTTRLFPYWERKMDNTMSRRSYAESNTETSRESGPNLQEAVSQSRRLRR